MIKHNWSKIKQDYEAEILARRELLKDVLRLEKENKKLKEEIRKLRLR